ncbi:MAG: hypothetical protein HUK20_01825 [Fibrobacter sp.]|nr:hypothetical protein [Fibrobacter sp.]
MMKQISLPLAVLAAFSFIYLGCSKDTDMGESFHYDTSLDYDETIMTLDSISDCLNSIEMERHDRADTVFINNEAGRKKLTFPSRLDCSKDNIKSVGVYTSGDTLTLETLEKEKSPGLTLDCPVWVYATLKKKLDGNYIKTRTGVYPLGKK